MRAGEIDIAFPLNDVTFAQTAGAGARISTWTPPNVDMFAMNVKAAPWSDIHVRVYRSIDQIRVAPILGVSGLHLLGAASQAGGIEGK